MSRTLRQGNTTRTGTKLRTTLFTVAVPILFTLLGCATEEVTERPEPTEAPIQRWDFQTRSAMSDYYDSYADHYRVYDRPEPSMYDPYSPYDRPELYSYNRHSPYAHPEPYTYESYGYDPFGPDRDCSDFSSQRKAQRFFEDSGGWLSDPHNLDRDNDGRACELLPP